MTQTDIPEKHVVIVGGGFAGVAAAKHFLKYDFVQVTLITPDDYLTYYPALYRYVFLKDEAQVKLWYSKIFENQRVDVVKDKVVGIVEDGKKIITEEGKEFAADAVVLATGSMANTYGIDGVDRSAYFLYGVDDAAELRGHIDMMVEKHVGADIDEQVLGLHAIVVGGGVSGVELAGGLACYMREKASKEGLSPSLVSVDLIERSPRVLARFPESISEKVHKRLIKLGVNIFPHRALTKSESWTVGLDDMMIGAKTLVWTAGLKPVDTKTMLEKVGAEVSHSRRGKIEANQYLQIEDTCIWVAGDTAETPLSGLAQTAIRHGNHVAKNIVAEFTNKSQKVFESKSVLYDVPVGKRWGLFAAGDVSVTGIIPWVMRIFVDIKYYISVLPKEYVWKLVKGLWRF